MRSLKLIRRFRQATSAAALAVLLSIGLVFTGLPVAVSAQATVTETTLSAAITADGRSQLLSVTSATSFAVGSVVQVDNEAMDITAVSGTTITVRRGTQGTRIFAHASGAVARVGLPSYFSTVTPAGVCTSTAEVALPRIVLPANGKPGIDVFQCSNSVWARYSTSGTPDFGVGLLGTTYTVAGAITIAPGQHFINGTTLAMTLANPTTAQNGMIMVITATNASAHTVTYTAGFNGGTAARDVATYGGAIGDNMVIIANAGVWWVISTRNVTLA